MATSEFTPLELQPGKVMYQSKYVWEFPVRLTHWVTAAAIFVLFVTGLYIAYPVGGPPKGEAYDNF